MFNALYQIDNEDKSFNINDKELGSVIKTLVPIQRIITARKRSLRRLCFHRCLSGHSGHRHPPPADNPRQATPQADTPLGRHPSPGQTPPCPVHAGIRSTSGWYASHWNAFFFDIETSCVSARSVTKQPLSHNSCIIHFVRFAKFNDFPFHLGKIPMPLAISLGKATLPIKIATWFSLSQTLGMIHNRSFHTLTSEKKGNQCVEQILILCCRDLSLLYRSSLKDRSMTSYAILGIFPTR